jgi:hypothetical protein
MRLNQHKPIATQDIPRRRRRMKLLQTRNLVPVIDEEDYPRVSTYNWCAAADSFSF